VPRSIALALPPVCLGVLLVSGVLEASAFGANPGRGALLGIATGFAYAAYLLVQRQGSMDLRRPGGALFEMSLVAAAVSLMIGFAVGADDLAPAWPSAGWLILLALTSQVLGWLLIGVLLGAILLAQEPSALQLGGCAMILFGLLTATGAARARRRPTPA
jgi:drug/metabolite transporter (DMT)-like permease